MAVCLYGAIGSRRGDLRDGSTGFIVILSSLRGEARVSAREVACPVAGWPRRTRPRVPLGKGGPFGARAGGAIRPDREPRGSEGRLRPIGARARAERRASRRIGPAFAGKIGA